MKKLFVYMLAAALLTAGLPMTAMAMEEEVLLPAVELVEVAPADETATLETAPDYETPAFDDLESLRAAAQWVADTAMECFAEGEAALTAFCGAHYLSNDKLRAVLYENTDTLPLFDADLQGMSKYYTNATVYAAAYFLVKNNQVVPVLYAVLDGAPNGGGRWKSVFTEEPVTGQWFELKDGGAFIDSFRNLTEEEIAGFLVAPWEPLAPVQPTAYTVTFQDWNGAELGSVVVEAGADATIDVVPQRTGYTFTGWNADLTGVTTNMTVTAQYTINTHDVIYMVDGAEHERIATEYGAAVTVASVLEKEGYTFSGWDVAEDFSMPDADVTISGSFTAIPQEPEVPSTPSTYRVTVHYRDESGKTLAQSYVERGFRSGKSYDVTQAAALEIEEYELVAVEGETAGIVRRSVTITATYRAVGETVAPEETPVPEVEEIPAMTLPETETESPVVTEPEQEESVGEELELGESETPLGDLPEESLSDGQVPMSNLPETVVDHAAGDEAVSPAAQTEGEIIIVDDAVPLGNLPQTGTQSDYNQTLLVLGMVLTLAGLGLLLMGRVKKETHA